MTSTAAVPELDTAGAVLAFARDRRAAADAAEADLLRSPPARGRTCTRRSRSGTRSGSGTPRSRSPAPARRWSRSSVWPSSRPRSGCPPRPARPTSARPSSCGTGSRNTWARVRSGELPAWRARRIARATIALSPAAAGFVDDQVAGFAHRIRPSGVDRLVEEAIVRFMPEEARRRREAAADGRHAHVHTHQVSFEGTVWVEAEVDLADALDLDTALSEGAARLADLGSTASLDVRRSEALGQMARHQLALDLDTSPDTGTDDPGPDSRPHSGPAGGAARAPLRPGDHGPRDPAAPGPGGEHPSLRRRRPGPHLVPAHRACR